MSARVYFMKRVKDFKDVSILSPQDEKCRLTSLLYNFLVLLSSTVYMQSKHKQNVYQTKLLQITAFSVGIITLNQRIVLKDYIEFITEFPRILEHPVPKMFIN